MKKTCFLLLSTELFFGAYAFAATPEVKLSGRKDRVLSYQMRERVLAVAESHLNQVNGGFGTKIEALDNPYVFKEVVEFVPRVADQKSDLIDASVVYDDASILAVIGLNLAKQVSGTLARGTTHYLQLQGGGMLKSGASFPAKIPQVAGQSFIVTLMNVNSRGYTLRMGDASLALPFDTASSVSVGVTKDSTQ
jgi:hypothetical protein